jgi:DNA-binding CsgD family transcriptional regulator
MTAGAGAVLDAARQVAVSHDEELREQAAATAARLRTLAEKLEWFGPVQQAQQLTFAAADAHAAWLLGTTDGSEAAAGPGAGGSGAGALRSGWDEAAAAWEAVSEPYPLAQALLLAAEAALACGDRDSAAARLTRAAPLAAGLGAQPLGQEIAILARRAGIRLARPADGEPGPDGSEVGHDAGDSAAGTSGLGLTGRELDVLRLVAAGRSNREIAAELFISPKTASVHVSNILGKLGAASRGEAAAKAHALRLFQG